MISCQKAMQKLLHGHGYANQLKRIMDNAGSESSSCSSMENKEDLANSVLHCFSDALSILIDINDQHQDHGLQSNNSSSSPEDSSLVLGRGRRPLLHKRGRKASTTESLDYHRHESSNPIYHDGFIWRKYGQKLIKESLHQRSYFKCAYTKEHNCQAKKQVQMIKEHPPLYSTTYFGHHTCQLLHQGYANFPIDDDSNYPQDHDLNMIRFDQYSNNSNFPSSYTSTSFHQNQIKDEYMTPDQKEEECWSPSQYMSSEVAHALEAFEFNPFWTSNDFS